MKCKNCGHGIIKTAAGDYIHWVSLNDFTTANHRTGDLKKVEVFKLNYFCANGWQWLDFCGCLKPEPLGAVRR